MSRWFWVLLAVSIVVGILFTAWVTTTCAETHGGHWWCWLR